MVADQDEEKEKKWDFAAFDILWQNFFNRQQPSIFQTWQAESFREKKVFKQVEKSQKELSLHEECDSK